MHSSLTSSFSYRLDGKWTCTSSDRRRSHATQRAHFARRRVERIVTRGCASFASGIGKSLARDKPVAVLALARATGDCTFSAPRKCAACGPGGAYHRAGGLPWRRRSLFWTAGASEGHDANDVFESTFAFFYPPTRGVQLATCSAAARRVKMIAGTYSSSALRLRQRASLRRALARWPFCRHSGASRHVTSLTSRAVRAPSFASDTTQRRC